MNKLCSELRAAIAYCIVLRTLIKYITGGNESQMPVFISHTVIWLVFLNLRFTVLKAIHLIDIRDTEILVYYQDSS